jgi:cytochrome c biogenesis protein CcdA
MISRIATICIAVLSLLLWRPATAVDDPWLQPGADGRPQVQFYFFWSASCPHCLEARPFVEGIPQRRPWVTLHSLELSRNPDNARFYQNLISRLRVDAAVPAFLFCGEMRIGWQRAATTGAEIERALDACRERALAGRDLATPAGADNRLALPWGGSVDAASLSLPALTVMLAALDAFNPCAFFVLLFLLSMMAHQGSRARMLAVGGIFVFFSGLMYFAFMAAWLNVFQLLGQLAWVTAAAGLVALVVGTINVKDFFAFKQGVSLSISDARRQNIFRRARAILDAERLPAMLAATVLLAIAANFYELLCTAGFPMVYTRLLTLHEPTLAGRYLYLALYNLIYVLPLAAIVAIFARTLGARKLDERQGRLLKLLSGLMMLGLGALLLLAPERTADALTGLVLIAVAAGLTWLAARRFPN